jgi:sugar O-acyltransferase (sialic acid O-acetyltransferase NeuD family)
MQRIAIIGAGGFAREVKWLISDINRAHRHFEFVGFVVSDLSKLGEHDCRNEVQGDLSWLENGADAVAIGIGNPAARLSIAGEIESRFPQLAWPQLIHPTVQMDCASAELGKGIILCAGTIGTVNVTIEDFAMVNLACTLGHESRLGRGSVLNPTVNVSGGVIIEDGVLIGTGAQILQYVHIGKGATLGAGAVATKDIPPGVTAVGIPAKAMLQNLGAMVKPRVEGACRADLDAPHAVGAAVEASNRSRV